MANYEFVVASNEFKTKNNEEVVEVFKDLGFEESYVTSKDFVFIGSYGEGSIGWDDCKVYRDKDTKKFIIAYDESMWDLSDLLVDRDMTGDDLANAEEVELVAYLQEMLLDNNFLAIKEIGNEKLRYTVACSCLITKTKEVWFNLNSCMEEELKKQGYKLENLAL